MGFPDFPIPESDKSYLPAKDMLAFLQSYADKHGVTELIKVNLFLTRLYEYRMYVTTEH